MSGFARRGGVQVAAEEVCEIKRGKRVVRKDLKDEGDCPVYQNSLIPLGFYDKANYKANTTFVSVLAQPATSDIARLTFGLRMIVLEFLTRTVLLADTFIISC